MENLFLKFLTVAAVVSVPLGLLLFPLRPWLERRYAPQTRWALWLWMTWLLLFGYLFAGWFALPQTTVTVPERLVSVPAVRVEAPSPFPAPVPDVPDGAEAPQVQPPAEAEPSSGVQVRLSERQLVPLAAVAGAVWLSVAVALWVIQYVRYFLARHRLWKASAPTEDFDELREEVYIQADIRRLPGLDSPMTMGTISPVVFLPEGDVDPMAVRHELTHLYRGDLVGRRKLFWVCAIYWFDPLVWYMARVAGRDMEAACDAQVTAGMSPAEKRAYGELLLSAAGGGRAAPLSTRFGGGKARMKARLAQLFRPGKSGKVMVAAVTVLGVLAVGVLACETGRTPMFSGTVYANVRYDALEPDENGETTSVPLELVDCVGGLVGDGYKAVTYPLPNTVTLDGRTAPREGWEEKYLFTFLIGPITSSVYTAGRRVLKAEVREGKIAAMEWLEDQIYVGGMLWHADSVPFALRLPASWRETVRMWEDPMSVSTDAQGWRAGLKVEFHEKGVSGQKTLLLTVRGMDETLFRRAYPGAEDGGGEEGIVFLGNGGGLMFYAEYPEAGEDDILTDEYLALSADCRESLGPESFFYLGAPDAYVNGRYDFTLALPESWRLHWWAREDNDRVDFFYRPGGDFTAEEKAPLFGLHFRKEYIPEENIRTDKLRYIGGGNGVYIYGYWPPEAPASRFRQAGDGIRYHQMYEDLQQMERTGWTLTFGLPDETADGGGAEEPAGKEAELFAAEQVEPPAVEPDADTRAAFQKVLTEARFGCRLPDGREADRARMKDGGARFAIADVDGDGAEELVLLYDAGPGFTAGMMGYVVGYDRDSGETYLQLSEFPSLHFYQGGAVQADAAFDWGQGELRPYTLYRHNPQTDGYEALGTVESWSKDGRDAMGNGDPFPDRVDKSGFGTVYYILRGDQTIRTAAPRDAADYAYWRRQYLGDVERELALDYRTVDRESIDSLAAG